MRFFKPKHPQPLSPTGRCEDCKTMRELTRTGFCSHCGSNSVFIPGALVTLRAAIRQWRPLDACWRY